MTHQLYWFCVAMYIAGLLLCLFWVTIPQLKKKAKAVNKPFEWKEWWSCDWNIVVGNLIFGAVLILGLDEIITWKPGVLDYVKWFFVIAGGFGTSIAQEKWGAFKNSLSKLVDIKANIADVVTGGTTTVEETIEKGVEATGVDVTKPKN